MAVRASESLVIIGKVYSIVINNNYWHFVDWSWEFFEVMFGDFIWVHVINVCEVMEVNFYSIVWINGVVDSLEDIDVKSVLDGVLLLHNIFVNWKHSSGFLWGDILTKNDFLFDNLLSFLFLNVTFNHDFMNFIQLDF